MDISVSRPEHAAALLQERLGIVRVERTGERGLRVFDGIERIAEMARILVADGLELTRLAAEEEDLEAYFHEDHRGVS